jgi:hypothetical protein
MELIAKLDDYGKPAWIAVMVLGFIIFWPVGLAILAYLIWSGRMGCWKNGGAGRWYNERKERRHAHRDWFHRADGPPATGNRAFDEYRRETLRRLEQEHEEFMGFLETLRQARDKAEFDQFMKDRRERTSDAEPNEPPAPQPAG